MNTKTVPTGSLVPKLLLMVALLLGLSPIIRASTDYPPAIWYPVCSGKWNTGGSGKRFYVIHDMEGYYASGRAYIARGGVGVSIHYIVNGKQDTSSDYPAGQISQLVRDAYYGWHALCWNGYSLGTEHEGFASNPAWYTTPMYDTSGACVQSECNKYGIAKDRCPRSESICRPNDFRKM